ncbi:uncharacterized protein LOC143434456 [Arvicanthis niloticus]|uniref:uncharacterized protein LOC143308863 n=1 Tax=Arvicanthis niloticus TaxID=61156 RepID=UPI00402BB825
MVRPPRLPREVKGNKQRLAAAPPAPAAPNLCRGSAGRKFAWPPAAPASQTSASRAARARGGSWQRPHPPRPRAVAPRRRRDPGAVRRVPLGSPVREPRPLSQTGRARPDRVTTPAANPTGRGAASAAELYLQRPELRILGLLESRGLESWMEVDKPHKYRRSTFEVLPKH